MGAHTAGYSTASDLTSSGIVSVLCVSVSDSVMMNENYAVGVGEEAGRKLYIDDVMMGIMCVKGID